jgi:CheY-like chemotaxis protein
VNATSLLLVDDDKAFRCTLGHELERTGCVVTLAASGEEALAKLAVNEPEIVLHD